jgi:hypothetical protein
MLVKLTPRLGAFLNRRVAEDFQRVVKLLSKNTKVCIITPNKRHLTKNSKKLQKYACLEHYKDPFCWKEEGKTGLTFIQNWINFVPQPENYKL